MADRIDEKVGLAMAEKNDFKMEITGGSNAFLTQGGNHTYTDFVAFQTNNGADSNGSKVSKDQSALLALLKYLIENRDKGHIKLLKECKEEDALEKFLNRSDASEDDMLAFQNLIYGVALLCIPDSYYGTAFLAEVPGVGTCLLSAGHCFESLLNNMSNDDVLQELDKYKIWFGNVRGVLPSDTQSSTQLEKDKPMNLKNFLHVFGCTGSISYDGKTLIFKERSNKISTEFRESKNKNIEDKDYCAIFLKNADKQQLSKYGLEPLQCGDRNNTQHEYGCIVTIVGHPGHKGWETWPQRLGYGTEVGQTSQTLQFNYDSLGGNSGSPVFGRGYKVKAIHVAASTAGPKNIGQKIDNIIDWINLGKKDNVQKIKNKCVVQKKKKDKNDAKIDDESEEGISGNSKTKKRKFNDTSANLEVPNKSSEEQDLSKKKKKKKKKNDSS